MITLFLAPVFLVLGFLLPAQLTHGDSLLTVTTGVPAANTSSDILKVLAALQKVTLPTTVFNDNTYQSLQDFSVTISPQVAGRQDPFLPISFFNVVSVPTPVVKSMSKKIKITSLSH